jgi:hypothetical protein
MFFRELNNVRRKKITLDLMTASVRLRRKKAPMNTIGTKKRRERILNALYIYTMITLHPSNVTLWKMIKREKKMLSKLVYP